MASIRKRGIKWYAEVWINGVRKGESFPTKGAAQAWSAETERRIKAGKSVFTEKTLEDAVMQYLLTVSPKKRSNAWEQRRGLWLCRDPLARTRLDLLTPQILADWRDARLTGPNAVSGSTVKRDFNFISAVLTVARKEWRWISVNPCADVARTQDNPSRKRRVTSDELATLYHVAGSDPATMQGRTILCFEFCIETALRVGEALQVGLHSRVGSTVHIPQTKNGDPRSVPLSPRAIEILDLVGGDFRLTNASRDALFRKVKTKAGLADLHFHDSRHEAVCRLSKIFNALDLARITGHRNINELLTYYHADAHELAVKLAAKTSPIQLFRNENNAGTG